MLPGCAAQSNQDGLNFSGIQHLSIIAVWSLHHWAGFVFQINLKNIAHKCPGGGGGRQNEKHKCLTLTQN